MTFNITPTPQWMWVYGKNMIFNNGKDDLIIPAGTEFYFMTDGLINCGHGVVIDNGVPLMKFTPIYGDDVYSKDVIEGAKEGQKILVWGKFPKAFGFPPSHFAVPLQHETEIVWHNYTGFMLHKFTVKK